MTSPITRLIDASVVCLRCGAQGMGSCGCYERCGRQGCDWLVSTTDDVCRNPLHREPPRDVACPHCKADPGQSCRTAAGIPMGQRQDGSAWVHLRRDVASLRSSGGVRVRWTAGDSQSGIDHG
jgi:hypothetical protein